jgi:hypothetical protein
MKIKGSSVAAIGIGAFLTGVVAGVAACRKDALRAAGQFFGGVVSGAGAVAVAVATAESASRIREQREMAERDSIRYYLQMRQERSALAMVLLRQMSAEERAYVRMVYGA